MMRGILTLASFISTVLFPWPLTATLALAVSLFEPLVPLSVGLFADVLYYTPQSGNMPIFTFYGALVTIAAFLVRGRLKTGIIGE
ncbi:MAG: hypothetical protein Q8L30_01105 [bacterium]|nr:hypothetical protein [bacterium]